MPTTLDVLKHGRAHLHPSFGRLGNIRQRGAGQKHRHRPGQRPQLAGAAAQRSETPTAVS